MKTCPECAEEIKLEAKVCRYCGTTFALASVGYCIRCHKVTAANELGVCAVCGSRLIDIHLESLEISGPTVGSQEMKSGVAVAPSVAPIPGAVPVAMPIAEAPALAEPTPVEPEVAPEVEPEPKVTTVWTPPTASEPDLPPAPSPPPGPPPGVAWAKPGVPVDTVPPVKEPAPPPAPPEKPVPPPGQPPAGQSPDIVAERLAAFGRRETPAPPPATPPSAGPPVAPPPGPPVAPPPGPPITPPARPPVTPGMSAQAAAAARPITPATPPVRAESIPEPVKEKPTHEKPAEPVAAAGQRLGIVPSLAQRAAYPFYLLAVIAVLAMWLLNYYWHHNLEGTSKIGSQTLSRFIVATNDGKMTFISWQIGLIAVICFLLMPTRLLPKGWFRERGVAKEFAKELKAELAVDMVFKQKLYFQKLMLAFALWAIAIGYLVATLVRQGSFVLKTGGYVTIVALLVGFACSGVLAVRREPVVAVDEAGRIQH